MNDYEKLNHEYDEAQKFIVHNIKNKENSIKEIQKEFEMVNFLNDLV
jgi:hypothetical protein